jgi:TonB family protein
MQRPYALDMKRKPPPRTHPRVWIAALVLALVGQLPLAWFLLEAGRQKSSMPSPSAVPRRAQVELVPVPKPKKPEEKPKGQVVSIPKPLKKQPPPKEARYLARHDQLVLKETKARRKDAGPARRKKVRVKKRSQVQSPESRDKRETRMESPTEAQRMASSTPLVEDLKGTRPRSEDRPRSARDVPFPKVPKAMDLGRVQALSASGGADDALPRVREEADETLLNAKRYRFVVFFERVKAQVRPYWEPNDALRRRDPTGRAYCCRDRLTVLRVVLDPKGSLEEIEVERKSGLAFLDREAVRAFRKASPYPNPPAELLEDGKVEFQFGFLLEFRDGRPFVKWVPPRPL